MALQDTLKDYTVEHPHPLLEAKTIQLVLFREILDYTVLRTEETREVNTVATPVSISGKVNERRVAFLATKQKAAESRTMEQMLRTAKGAAKLTHVRRKVKQGDKEIELTVLTDQVQSKDEEIECYLKDWLCLSCPRCGLYGGTNVQSGGEKIGNIKHRLEYGTAFSLLPFKDIGDATTFNGIDDMTQKTGQALGTRYSVIPATVFPSIVTLRSVTWREFVLIVKTVLACKSYGAESRIGGDARNTIAGIVAGWEEVITPLELTLELYTRCIEPDGDKRAELNATTVSDITKSYLAYAGNPDHVRVFAPNDVGALVQEVCKVPLDRAFLEATYSDISEYRKAQKAAGEKK